MKALSALVVTTAVVLSAKAQASSSLSFEMGYRSDDVSWNHRVQDDVRPNTKSKLTFKDLEIFQIGARLKSTCGDCLYYRLDAHYGWILDGTLRESLQIGQLTQDCNVCNPTCTINPVFHNDVRQKYAADFNLAFGYPLEWCLCSGLQIIPTIGFEYDTLRINSKNHENLVNAFSGCETVLGDFDLNPCCGKEFSSCSRCSSSSSEEQSSSSCSGRNSSNKFKTTVWGPWIGFDLAYCHKECWNVYAEFQFQFSRIRRERNSCNVGFRDLDNHRRTRSACGFSAKIGSLYFFRCDWFIDGNLFYKRWFSDRSRDHLTWRQAGVGVGIGRVF